jgi:DNA-binding response OmpR family regulator
VTRDGRSIELTPREFTLLETLLASPGQVFSREALLDLAWGYDFVGASKIVDVYVGYLRKKLRDQPPRIIRAVRGVGYAVRAETA